IVSIMPRAAKSCTPFECTLGIDIGSTELSKAESKHLREYHSTEPVEKDSGDFILKYFRQESRDWKYVCPCGNTYMPSSSVYRHLNFDECKEISDIIQEATENKVGFESPSFHLELKHKKFRADESDIKMEKCLTPILDSMNALRPIYNILNGVVY
ncbi:hypothetical protein BGX27_004542, partial [Mortierella sp. AM989]